MQINSEEIALQTNNKTYHRKSPLFENFKDEVIFLLHDLTAGSRIFYISEKVKQNFYKVKSLFLE